MRPPRRWRAGSAWLTWRRRRAGSARSPGRESCGGGGAILRAWCGAGRGRPGSTRLLCSSLNRRSSISAGPARARPR
eukprot:6369082-Pyramimonas_sp.AAC.1